MVDFVEQDNTPEWRVYCHEHKTYRPCRGCAPTGTGAEVYRDAQKADPVNHPKHYTAHPSGVECIQITEHMGFNLGNAMKYIWRADEKGAALQDLEKAVWYIKREIAKRTRK
jgi:hypothetical protein